ncbi:MAG: hypothetical protein H6698_00715 [Myxococcales bacterium]|nr:hypothetical protein [Myxococcales bacterium]MCB9531954.1 hypothetical protein [Myxococcales bacterium]MCB9532833.1 hypothetical protein [Myxococcales bacterium]
MAALVSASVLACQDVAQSDAGAELGSDAADRSDAVDTPPGEGSEPDAVVEERRCNGREDLCGRTFDEVVLAGTHNSMSNESDGFFAPNQHRTLRSQLEAGVRAMLIDTYRDDEGLALCHGSCFLGRTDAIAELGAIDAFLDANPHEVMAFIFEDHIEMADSVALLEASGLAARALTPPPPGQPWPTVEEMIDSGARVLLTHESGTAGPDWFPAAWSVFVDTPYSFERPEDFSCAVNRGAADRPLRLLNHWISDPLPRPENAAVVNVSDVLLPRARECWDAWGAPPTIVAVDFEDLGDLTSVVDALNDEVAE